MKGLTDYITKSPWEDIITIWFVHIDEHYQAIVALQGGVAAPARVAARDVR